jgi:hypothetical protein
MLVGRGWRLGMGTGAGRGWGCWPGLGSSALPACLLLDLVWERGGGEGGLARHEEVFVAAARAAVCPCALRSASQGSVTHRPTWHCLLPLAAGIAAYGCIKALNTLLESVASLKPLFPALEELLFPIMQKNISTDGQDIFEEVLEMLSYFTYYGDAISPRLWSLWPQVCVVYRVCVGWGQDGGVGARACSDAGVLGVARC